MIYLYPQVDNYLFYYYITKTISKAESEHKAYSPILDSYAIATADEVDKELPSKLMNNDIIIGNPKATFNMPKATIYTDYPPKDKYANYHYKKDTPGLLLFIVELSNYDKNYITMLDDYKSFLKELNMLYGINTPVIAKDAIVNYIGAYSMYKLIKFNGSNLDKNIIKELSHNYAKDELAYLKSKVQKANTVTNSKGTFHVASVDKHMTAIAKCLAGEKDIAMIHKGSFVMMYSKHNIKPIVEELAPEKSYEYNNGVYTFFVDSISQDRLALAIVNL